MRSIVLAILLFAGASGVKAQAEHDAVGNWLMYFGQNRLSDNWSIHSELQFRFHKPAPVEINQIMARFGMNFHFGPASFVTAGYAFIPTHTYESPQKNAESLEHRFFQQFFIQNTVNYLTVQNRYRVEERWVNGIYSTRLRYMINFILPITNARLVPKTFFLRLYDEIFMNVKQTYFDRNRFYLGAGYKVSKALTLELGFMQQQSNVIGKRQLQFGMTLNPDFRKKKDVPKKTETEEGK